jgi:Zn-dependent protease with chaperone function
MSANGRRLRLLLWWYVPFLGLLLLLAGSVAVLLFALVAAYPSLICLLFPALVLVVLTLHLFAPYVQLPRRRRRKDPFELQLPRREIDGLYRLVESVARQWGFVMPDRICLHAESVAHVYEDDDGRTVLVVGGFAVAAYTQEALAGIIAHELAHLAVGDRRLKRFSARFVPVMEALDWYFEGGVLHWFSPLAWALLAYHRACRSAWAAHSREEEFAADRYSVHHVGPETVAAALIYLTVTEYLPWARLLSIVQTFVATNEPMNRVFAEQVRLARMTSRWDWQEACKKALKRRTGRFDSHPALRERLAAMGVSAADALALALDQPGTPARELFGDWDRLERTLSERLLLPYRIYLQQKMEVAQIIAGRPIGRA